MRVFCSGQLSDKNDHFSSRKNCRPQRVNWLLIVKLISDSNSLPLVILSEVLFLANMISSIRIRLNKQTLKTFSQDITLSFRKENNLSRDFLPPPPISALFLIRDFKGIVCFSFRKKEETCSDEINRPHLRFQHIYYFLCFAYYFLYLGYSCFSSVFLYKIIIKETY